MRKIWFVLVLTAVALSAYLLHSNAVLIIDWIDTIGLLAPIVFVILYGLSTIFFLPTMVLTLAGGALFGPMLGTCYNLFGASIGAVFAFIISRYWLRDWFSSRKNAQLNRIIIIVESKGWPILALMRLLPIVPFSIVNYGLGLTGIKFRHYFFTTFIFLIPAEILYTYCGFLGMDVFRSPEFYKHTNYFILGFILLILAITFTKRKPLFLKERS